MSKKFITLSLVAAAVAALAVAQTSSNVYTSFQQALAKANSLDTTYSVSSLGGATASYSVTLKKPNLAFIDTPTSAFIADGKQITTFSKADKAFYKQPQSPELLSSLFQGDALKLWSGFFTAPATKGSARDLPARDRGGESFPGFELSSSGTKASVYVSGRDYIARQATFDATNAATVVLNTRSMTVDGNVLNSRFAFKAPADAKEVDAAELNAVKWVTSLDEAKRLAAAGNKKIFVDFMATWCGPCKLLEAQVFTTDKFKKYGSKLVFLKVDVDAQKTVASAYQITAMPTQMVLAKDGSIVSSTVGYGSPETFYSWLDGALGN
jgi:thiol-disulfide isomerase/thioredoxin